MLTKRTVNLDFYAQPSYLLFMSEGGKISETKDSKINNHVVSLLKELLKDILESYSRKIILAVVWKIAAEMGEEESVMERVEAGRPDWSLK